MIRLAADEDFDNDILRGLRRRVPHVDILRVQDAGLSGPKDLLASGGVWRRQSPRHGISKRRGAPTRWD